MAKIIIIIEDVKDADSKPGLAFSRKATKLPKKKISPANCVALHFMSEVKNKLTLGKILRKAGVI